MGRGRVQLKRIENKISRQVTFSKRRNGLLKKAHEISVLCDAEVALIIFSTKGKLFEYSTNSCMESILERYERCSHSERQVPNHCEEANWSLECHKLMARTEVLQRNLRNLAGEDLDPMSLRELQHLEQQIDTALKRIRSRKHQLYQESISDLQKKERALHNQNNILTQQLTENGKTLADEHAQWKQQNLGQNSSASIIPLLPLPSLTIGGNLQTRDFMIENEEAVAQTQQPYPTQMPSWMLRHVNE